MFKSISNKSSDECLKTNFFLRTGMKMKLLLFLRSAFFMKIIYLEENHQQFNYRFYFFSQLLFVVLLYSFEKPCEPLNMNSVFFLHYRVNIDTNVQKFKSLSLELYKLY